MSLVKTGLLRVIIENSQASPSEQGAGTSEGAATIYINMSCHVHVTLQIWADGHHRNALPPPVLPPPRWWAD